VEGVARAGRKRVDHVVEQQVPFVERVVTPGEPDGTAAVLLQKIGRRRCRGRPCCRLANFVHHAPPIPDEINWAKLIFRRDVYVTAARCKTLDESTGRPRPLDITAVATMRRAAYGVSARPSPALHYRRRSRGR